MHLSCWATSAPWKVVGSHFKWLRFIMDHPANLPACLTIKKIWWKRRQQKKRVVLLIKLMKSWHNGTRSWRQQSDTNALSFLAWKPIFIKKILNLGDCAIHATYIRSMEKWPVPLMTLVPFRCCPLRAVRSLFPWPREGQELTTSRTASPWWTGSGPPILGSRFIFLFLDINIIWVAIQICK